MNQAKSIGRDVGGILVGLVLAAACWCAVVFLALVAIDLIGGKS